MTREDDEPLAHSVSRWWESVVLPDTGA